MARESSVDNGTSCTIADGRATAFVSLDLERDPTGAPEDNGAHFDEHGQRVVDGQWPLSWDESGLRSVSRNGRRRQHGPLLHGVQAVWLTVAGGQVRPELRLTAPTLSPLVWFDPAQGSVSRTALHTPTGDVDETPDWTVRSRSIDEDPTTTYGYQRFRSTANGRAWLNDAGARRFVPGAGVYLEPDPILPADEDVLPGLWLHARGDPYHVVDPDGRCGLVGAAVGGAVGAVLGGAFALYNGDDPATALARAVVGGLGGSVLGATCGLAASAGAGGVVGAFQGGVNTALDTRGAPLTLAELGRGALVGGVGGALAGVAGSYLGGRTDLNAFARVTLNTYADLGADLLAPGAGTALGGGPVDLQRAVFAAAFGTGVRAVHLGGASAAAALRARTAAATPSEFGGAGGALRLHRHPRGATVMPFFGKKSGRAADMIVAARAGAESLDSVLQRGVFFFGDDILPYVNRMDATLGRAGDVHFFMPLEDSVLIRNVGEAARASGYAPSITRAYKQNGAAYGVSFPTVGTTPRLPKVQDAGGFPHFLGGGKTAAKLPGPNGGYLVNQCRSVIDVGWPCPLPGGCGFSVRRPLAARLP